MDTIHRFIDKYFDIEHNEQSTENLNYVIASNYEEEFEEYQNIDVGDLPNICAVININEFKRITDDHGNLKEDLGYLLNKRNVRILFATEKINYKLPDDYAMFYHYYFKVIRQNDIYMKKFRFRFVDDLMINPGMVAHPDEPFIDPFSHTCDEWVIIARDEDSVDLGGGAILINCNPEGKHFGKLLFYSSNDEGTGYMPGFYFDDFLVIMMDHFDIMMEMKTEQSDSESSDSENLSAYASENSDVEDSGDNSIVDYFSYSRCFNANDYFTKRNEKIMPIINKYLPADLCKVILGYVYCQ